jgi:hypothetical protein
MTFIHLTSENGNGIYIDAKEVLCVEDYDVKKSVEEFPEEITVEDLERASKSYTKITFKNGMYVITAEEVSYVMKRIEAILL